ncbi:MAG: HAD hydrolase-like protein [Candidatus Heimdallarchaeota archaeon]|nr:HAD hydrolase-like protein [Candidatus Heimdallarchaeota archaeon]
MIKLITLDFDGTTANTMPTLEQIAVRLMTNHYSLEKAEAVEKYRMTTGLPFEQQIELLFPEEEQNQTVIAQFEKEKIERIFDLPLFPDAKETINYLQNHNFLVAISSSTFQATIEEYCRLKGLEVDQILGYAKGFEKGKDHFDFLMKKFNLTPEEIIYVGDSLKDCERAQGSNILFIAKIGMFSKEQFDSISESKLAIYSLSELKDLVWTLND